jgi:uncharacterized protein (TIGR03032 family)
MSNTSLWDNQKKSLRDPREIWTYKEESSGINKNSLGYKADRPFIQLLAKLGITLFISREYENLLISIYSDGERLIQRYTPIAHPSGVVCDRKAGLMYVASTRNPNIIYQFRICGPGFQQRVGHPMLSEKLMVVSRTKYYPGMYYFHDLSLISGELYANAVGLNGIVKINMSNHLPELISWYPKCIENKKGLPRIDANYIQLNSIAEGGSLESSYFSASSDKISKRRPGHLNYPVDRRGVIISGATRETVARGLTRPHSARLNRGKIWVANSGYGEFGFISGESFEPIIKLNGWTRGVCIHNNIAFVATSRVIPQYRHYAPGLDGIKDQCALHAISLSTGKIVGSVKWPAGNQVFAIDYLSQKNTIGLLNKNLNDNLKAHTLVAFNHT